MILSAFKNTVLLFVFMGISCGNTAEKTTASKTDTMVTTNVSPIVGANSISDYIALIQNKRVGIVANQTSVIFKDEGYVHLVDSLLQLNIDVKKVYAPEHGFRGKSDAGELLKDSIDSKTGTPIVSIYGKDKKPSAAVLQDIDIMMFDIQDVGARFYTYISTLHYVMEACAEQNIPLLILDRPNPNGHYIDGPILEPEHKSFIGMHPIPVVHGMTIGEYAKMINGEGWLNNGVKCDITIIPVKHYTHQTPYSLPIEPSPNLPNDKAINLYPSLCFFEGTNVSAGRGTDLQFQIYGSPELPKRKFSFTPAPNVGSKYPKHDKVLCYGENLTDYKTLETLNLSWLINAYKTTSNPENFFLKNKFFYKLAGTKSLQEAIEQGQTEAEIKASWQPGLKRFKTLRQQYLIYP